MITFSADATNALASGQNRIGVFFRMGLVAGPNAGHVIRLWFGIGNIEPGVSALDATGAVYSGLGQIAEIPAIQQLINGVADRATFHLSGVSEEMLNVASGESEDVKGSAVALGVCIFGGSWQQLSVPIWLWQGHGDFLTVSQDSDGERTVRVIELSVGSRFTGRRRRGLTYLTDSDQQKRHPGDRFCERTILYSQEVEKVWPRFLPP